MVIVFYIIQIYTIHFDSLSMILGGLVWNLYLNGLNACPRDVIAASVFFIFIQLLLF
jgi:hypothetical protein